MSLWFCFLVDQWDFDVGIDDSTLGVALHDDWHLMIEFGMSVPPVLLYFL